MKSERKGVDTQLAGLRLTPEERELLELRSRNVPYAVIAKTLFEGKRSRQAIQQLEGRVRRKQWFAGAQTRYAANLSDCPIEEAPLPVRVKRALKKAGLAKVGHLVGIPDNLPDLGKQGAFYVKQLLTDWDIQKPATYCVDCGAAIGKRHKEEKFQMQCPRCKGEFSVTVLQRAA